MSQGIIPVAYPVGVAPEIITDNKNGFLARNQKEAKVYIENILKMDEEKRKKPLPVEEALGKVCVRFGCLEFDILNEPSDMVV